MKTFQQFQENVEQLRRGLETLERQSAPKQRLAARREAAKRRSRQLQAAETQRQREYQERQTRKRKQRNEELQLEQDPHMTPTPFNIIKAREQAKGGIKQRTHVHQEIGATARSQEAAHQARLKKLTGTP